MKQTNVTHNIRVDRNKSNRMVLENCPYDYLPYDRNREYVRVNNFGMAMVNRKRGKRR